MKDVFSSLKDGSVSKGGLLGAILGVLMSLKSHQPTDKPLKKAGKTALFTGIGYFLGDWIAKKTRK